MDLECGQWTIRNGNGIFNYYEYRWLMNWFFELKCWQWATELLKGTAFFWRISHSVAGGCSAFNLLFIMIQSNELLLLGKKINFKSFLQSFVRQFCSLPFHGVKIWNAISLIAVNVHYHFQFPLEFHVNLKCTPNCWIRCAFHTSLCRIG